MNMKKKDYGTDIIKYLLSAAFACFLLYFTFRGVKWDAFLEGLKSCRLSYIAVSMGAGIAAFWFRGLRWREILRPIDRSITRRAAFNAVNIGYIANFVLGVYGRGLDASLKSNFVKEFAELNVYTFAQKFVAYSDQKIEVVSVNPGKKEGQFFVSSKVISSNPGDKDFIVDWRLEKEGDSYKVIDVIIEGVSMAMSYKNEYAPILKMASDEGKNPVEELILKIKDKIVQLKEQK